MRTIWKYNLSIVDCQPIDLPIGTTPLSVHLQHGEPCLWVLVDASDKPLPTQKWEIRIFGTGQPVISKPHEFIGTFLIRQDTLVFHVFARNMDDPEYKGVFHRVIPF